MDFVQELSEYTRLQRKIINNQLLTEQEQCSFVVIEQVLRDNNVI